MVLIFKIILLYNYKTKKETIKGKGQMYKRYVDVDDDRKNPQRIRGKKIFLHNRSEENVAFLSIFNNKKHIEIADIISNVHLNAKTFNFSQL